MYTALQIVRIPTGQHATEIDRHSGRASRIEWFRVEWKPLGPARDMAEAKRIYGGSPVLEVVR